MKAVVIASMVALAAATATPAQASPELAKAKCGKCHEMDKKKKGPPYKESAAKFKGKPDAENTMFKLVTDPKGDHPEFEASPEDTRAVLKWILSI